MKVLKTSFLLFVFALLFSCNTNKKAAEAVAPTASNNATTEAPAAPRREGRRGQGDPEARQKRMEEMYAQLNLSEAQKEKVEAIVAKYQEKRSALFQNNEGDRETMRTEMQKQRAEQNKEIEGVMTKEQFAKYLEIQEQQRGNRGGRGRGE